VIYLKNNKASLEQLKQDIEDLTDDIGKYELIKEKEQNIFEKLEDLYRTLTIKIKEFIPYYIELSGYEKTFDNKELEEYKEKLLYYDEKYISTSEQLRGHKIYFGVYLRLNKLLYEIYLNKRNQVTHNYPNINYDFNDFKNEITPKVYNKIIENLIKAIQNVEFGLNNTENVVSDIDKFLKDSYEILGDLYVHKGLIIKEFQLEETIIYVNEAKNALDNYNKAIKYGKKLEEKNLSYFEFKNKADIYMDIFNNFLYEDKLGNIVEVSGLIEKRNHVEKKFNIWKKLTEQKFKTKPLKGMKDFFPEDLREVNWILSVVKEVADLYCYDEFEGPLLEPIEIFAAKSSFELVYEQSFYIEKFEDKKIILSPELTPTLARMVAEKSQEIKKPIRWYSVPTCFRWEQPQRGRLRSFKQVNFDILDENSLYAEMEILNIAIDILTSFGATAEQFQIYYNNRRFIDAICEFILEIPKDQMPLVYKILDKSDKLNENEFEKYIIDSFHNEYIIQGILKLKEAGGIKDLLRRFDDIPQRLYEADGYKEIIKLENLLEENGLSQFCSFSSSIVRGLDYYTGTVFEVFDTGTENRRAIFGGGRYDDLLSLFSEEKLSGIGFGMGVLMLSLFLKTYKLIPDYIYENDYSTTIYIASINKKVSRFTNKIAQKIRDEDFPCIVDYGFKNLKNQLKKARELGVLLTIIIGPKEMEEQRVTFRKMKSGEEKFIDFNNIIKELYYILEEFEKQAEEIHPTKLKLKWKRSLREKERKYQKPIIQYEALEPINLKLTPYDERIPPLEFLIKNLTIEYYKEGFQKSISRTIYQLISIINRFRPDYLERFAPQHSVNHKRIISYYFDNINIQRFKEKIGKEEIVYIKLPSRYPLTHAGDLAYVIYEKYRKNMKENNILIDDARKDYQYTIQSKNNFFKENYKHNIFENILAILERYGIIKISGPYTGSDCNETYNIYSLERLQNFIQKYSLQNLLEEVYNNE